MDRLFERASPEAFVALAELADVEQRLAAHRRQRHMLVGGAALASALCWIHTNWGVHVLVCAPPLFAFFTCAAASLYFWERRLDAKVRRHRVSLVAKPSGTVPLATAQIRAVDERLRRIRFARRAIMTAVAASGVAPFLRAVAPDLAPWLTAPLGMLWAAMLRVLVVAIMVERLSLRDWRRM
jgi:hypothetical protein